MQKKLEALLPTLPAPSPENKPMAQRTVARAAEAANTIPGNIENRSFNRQSLLDALAKLEPQIPEAPVIPTSPTLVDNIPDEALDNWDPEISAIEEQFDNPENLHSLLELYNAEYNQYNDPQKPLSETEQNHLKNLFEAVVNLRDESENVFINKCVMIKKALKPIVDNLTMNIDKIQQEFAKKIRFLQETSDSPETMDEIKKLEKKNQEFIKKIGFLQEISDFPDTIEITKLDKKSGEPILDEETKLPLKEKVSTELITTAIVLDKRKNGPLRTLDSIKIQLKQLNNQEINVNEITNQIQTLYISLNNIDVFIEKIFVPAKNLAVKMADKLKIEII